MMLIPKQIELIDNWLNEKIKNKRFMSKIFYTFSFYSPLIFIISSFLRFFIWGDPFIESILLTQPMYMMKGGKAVMEGINISKSFANTKITLRFFSAFTDKNQKMFASLSALQLNTITDNFSKVKNLDIQFTALKNFSFGIPYRLENVLNFSFRDTNLIAYNGGVEVQSTLKFVETLVKAPSANTVAVELFKKSQHVSLALEANDFREILTTINTLTCPQNDIVDIFSLRNSAKSLNTRQKLIESLTSLLFTPAVLEYNSFSNVHPDKFNFGVIGFGIQQVLLENFNLLLEFDNVSPEIKFGLFHMWLTSEGRVVQNLLQMIFAYITATERCTDLKAELLFISALPNKFTGCSDDESKFFTSAGDFIFYFRLKSSLAKSVFTEIVELKQTPKFIDIAEFNKSAEMKRQFSQEFVEPKLTNMRKHADILLNFLGRRPNNHNVIIVTPNSKLVIPYTYTVEENFKSSKGILFTYK
jgi:hypothetical protein